MYQRLRRAGLRVSEFTFTTSSWTRLPIELFGLLRDRGLDLPGGDDDLLDELAAVRLIERGPASTGSTTTPASTTTVSSPSPSPPTPSSPNPHLRSACPAVPPVSASPTRPAQIRPPLTIGKRTHT